jgi:4'-phosphopantetheinyl transferase
MGEQVHEASAAGRRPIPRLRLAEAHVWWAGRRHASAGLRRLLDDTERMRLSSYAREEDRARFLVGCTLAKLVVAGYLACPPSRIRFSRTCPSCGAPHGKPRLVAPPGPAVELSISHSADLVVVALTAGPPVGVDVEWLGRSAAAGEVEELVLAEGELRALAELGRRDRDRNFLVWWTRKEAVVKACGAGLGLPLPNVVVTRPDEPARLLAWPLDVAPEQVALFDLGVRDGHLAALAVLGACTSVREFAGAELLDSFVAGRLPPGDAELDRSPS